MSRYQKQWQTRNNCYWDLKIYTPSVLKKIYNLEKKIVSKNICFTFSMHKLIENFKKINGVYKDLLIKSCEE